MTTDRVGFVGLGNMGGAIAERFLSAGHPLTVFDVDPGHLRHFEDLGAKVATSPRKVADQCEIVFACLPTTQISLDVALGADGVREGSAIKVYVDTGTIGMAVATKISQGLNPAIGFVDAPVSGGPPGARAGTLTTMVSGAPSAYLRALPFLEVMAKNVFLVGDKAGQAQIAKLINNHLSAAHRLATFEGLVLALRAGLDLKTLVDVINVSSGRSYTTTDKVPQAILSGDFKFNGRLAISIKDQTLLQEEAEALGAKLWVAPRLLETLKEAAAAGYADRDSMFLIQYMGEQAGLDVQAMMQKDK